MPGNSSVDVFSGLSTVVAVGFGVGFVGAFVCFFGFGMRLMDLGLRDCYDHAFSRAGSGTRQKLKLSSGAVDDFGC